MTICPKDGKQCWDDVCRGTGLCARSGGRWEAIEICSGCGELEDLCSCYYDEYDDDYCPACYGIGEGPCVCLPEESV